MILSYQKCEWKYSLQRNEISSWQRTADIEIDPNRGASFILSRGKGLLSSIPRHHHGASINFACRKVPLVFKCFVDWHRQYQWGHKKAPREALGDELGMRPVMGLKEKHSFFTGVNPYRAYVRITRTCFEDIIEAVGRYRYSSHVVESD